MFATVVVHKSKELNPHLLSCFSLVADNIYTGEFYISAYWAFEDLMQIYIKNGIEKKVAEEIISEKLGPRPKKSNSPYLGYLRDDDYFDEKKEKNKFYPIGTELVLSKDDAFHRAMLAEKGINANTVLLCLAAAGVEIMLPPVIFSNWKSEEIERLKSDLAEERYLYLEALSSTAAEAMDAMKNENLEDVYRWAQNNAILRIAPLAKRIEEAASKGNKGLLSKAGYKIVADGVPVIGGAAVAGGLTGAAFSFGIETFKALVSTLKGRQESMAHPQVGYILKIKSALSEKGSS